MWWHALGEILNLWLILTGQKLIGCALWAWRSLLQKRCLLLVIIWPWVDTASLDNHVFMSCCFKCICNNSYANIILQFLVKSIMQWEIWSLLNWIPFLVHLTSSFQSGLSDNLRKLKKNCYYNCSFIVKTSHYVIERILAVTGERYILYHNIALDS